MQGRAEKMRETERTGFPYLFLLLCVGVVGCVAGCRGKVTHRKEQVYEVDVRGDG